LLQINSAKNWAGGEVHVFLLSKELIALGEEVTLVCRSGSEIEKRFRAEDIPVVNLPLKGAADLKSARLLARYCREHNETIVHAHLGRDYWTALLAKVFNPDIKVVLTRHILVPLKKTIFHRWIYKKVDKIIAVSKAVAATLTQFPVAKVTVIYNGIDLDKFTAAKPGKLRAELGLDNTTKIVGMVGHVSSHKGHDTFLKSIPAIQEKCPDAKFVVVGDDFRDGEYISQLKKLNDDVSFLGPRTNIPEIMKDIDVLVVASLIEAFGLVTVEAMAAGVPVVATDIGGTSEIVTNGETGILFSPNNAAELATAVITLLTNQQLAQHFINKGQAKVNAMFSLKQMAAKTLEIYRSI
jgi:glycosyltransferase involved in cell wall biosynthesis